MDNKKLKHIKNTFTRQLEQRDCGVACLISILKYYGGKTTFEHVREKSGTNIQGTSLLGLYQCAIKMGFNSDAYSAKLENLRNIKEPVILHVNVNYTREYHHYVVLYGFDLKSGTFVIGDPAKGIVHMGDKDILAIWQHHALLTITPGDKFIITEEKSHEKWNWFLSVIKEDQTLLIINTVLALLITVLGFSTAIFTQKLIDEYIPKGDFTNLQIPLSILLFGILLRSVFGYIKNLISIRQSTDFNTRIVGRFIDSLMFLPKSFFDSRKLGELVSRISDTERVQRSVSFIVGSAFSDLVIIIGTSLFIINYSLSISLIILISVPIFIAITWNFTKPIAKNQRQSMATNAMYESDLFDTIGGIDVIKGQKMELFFAQKVQSTYQEFQLKNFNLGKIASNFNFSTDLFNSLLTIALFGVSAYMVINKELAIGEMVAVLTLTSLLITSVGRLAQFNLLFQEAKTAFDRMYEFTSIEKEFSGDKAFESNEFETFEIKNLSFSFPGRKPILTDINLDVKKGETIALLGESGCGKSTIVSLIQGFLSIDNGILSVNGQDLSTIDLNHWRSMLATVPQEIKIFNGTLMENISLVPVPLEVIKAFCIKYGFDKFFKQLPNGYYTHVGEDGVNLSGGQKQLLAIARALFRKPKVLVLDEATAAMDRNTEQFIHRILKQVQSEMAIIVVTHKFASAKSANRIYLIENGKIQDFGSPKSLITGDNLFASMWQEFQI